MKLKNNSIKESPNSMRRWLVLAPVAMLTLMSCSTLAPTSNVTPQPSSAVVGDAANANPETLAISAAALADSVVEEGRADPVLYKGNDKLVRLPAAAKPVKFIGDAVSLNFENAPLDEVMHAILGDILGLDYIVDQPVKGQVTLRTRTPVSRDDVFSILESLLKANQVLMIRGDDGRYLITGSQQASRLAPGVSNGNSPGAGFSTMIVPLQYISAANMAEILSPVASDEALVRVDNTRNLLMLAGTGAQLEGWMDMVLTFDVDMLAGMSVGMFPLENSSVQEMNEVLTGLLGKGGVAADLSHLVRILPIERLNSIMVVTPRAHYLERIRVWMERLDVDPNSNFEKRLYVYPVQNTTAGRLADLLNSIYSGSGGGSSSGSSRSNGMGGSGLGDVAPGLNSERLGGESGSVSGGSGAGSSMGGANNQAGGSVGGSSSARLTGSDNRSGGSPLSGFRQSSGNSSDFSLSEVRVVADDENNALMIYARGKDYKTIKSALDQLDVVATQVIIEASIIEVTLTDDLQYGVEWAFNGGIGSDYQGSGALRSSTVSAIATGFSYAVTNAVGDIRGILNALAEESLLNVISSPSVMVLDNQEAYIHVGDQQPVSAGTTVTDGGTVVENIAFKDTGVKLTVRPSVNAGGLVTMDVMQSVTDVGKVDAATGQRAFLERNISSRVAVRSGESIVLGGLIQENASSANSGVPLLSKIPVLGALFGSTQTTDTRTELLVIITPTAIYSESELRDVSRQMRSQIRAMELIDIGDR
ncbi:MAG: general secretion pathway protein D [Halioglobus sp.]|jgi:general secretion pathway protein D